MPARAACPEMAVRDEFAFVLRGTGRAHPPRLDLAQAAE